MKRCPRCGKEKASDEFWKAARPSDGLQVYCKVCQSAQMVATRRRGRAELIAAYGGKCECCGETTDEFLAVDHINGGGGKHRRTLGGNAYLYPLLKRLGYPKEDYRLLCHNCNSGLGHYGYCPHESLRIAWG